MHILQCSGMGGWKVVCARRVIRRNRGRATACALRSRHYLRTKMSFPLSDSYWPFLFLCALRLASAALPMIINFPQRQFGRLGSNFIRDPAVSEVMQTRRKMKTEIVSVNWISERFKSISHISFAFFSVQLPRESMIRYTMRSGVVNASVPNEMGSQWVGGNA